MEHGVSFWYTQLHTLIEDAGNEILVNELSGKVCSPPLSPNLSTCSVHLWSYLKGKVYELNFRVLYEQRKNIRSAFGTIEITV